MNINDLSTQLIYTTVPIYVQKYNGEESTGTGFIFSIVENDDTSIPLLITNYHVLENTKVGYIEFHIGENNIPTKRSTKVKFDSSIVGDNKLGELDLIAVPIAATLTELQKNNINIFFRSVDQNIIPTDEQCENFSAIEKITFIGYPNGLYDEKNKISVIREGITATPIWNDFKGESAFLIDAGVFPGSSGSPVFIYNQGTYPIKDGIALGNRLLFVGVISQHMLHNNVDVKSFLNLGKVINSRAMYIELERFIKNLKSGSN